MSKRIYKPKPKPLAVQVHIQHGIIAQCESALEQARRALELWDRYPDQSALAPCLRRSREDAARDVAYCEHGVAIARERLEELLRQAVEEATEAKEPAP